MNTRFSRIVSSAFVVIVIAASCAFSDYKEGVDTTYPNGNSRDSLFGISTYNLSVESGSTVVTYKWNSGYFNHAFEDIAKAPDTIKNQYPSFSMGTSYVIYRNKTGTYSKISVMSKLPDNRYVYRFGMNTVADNKLLITANYDRSVKYKPNNLRFISAYEMPRTFSLLFWEPPVPGVNKLIGYTFYASKSTSTIDTTKPINPAQWDSIAFTTKTDVSMEFKGRYINMVAVYENGKSDFLKGWMKEPMLIGVSRPASPNVDFRPYITVAKNPHTGYCFEISPTSANASPQSIAIYSNSGCLVTDLKEARGGQYFWNPKLSATPKGLYIVKALFPDNSIVSRQFMFLR
jgi:hypothetical protein